MISLVSAFVITFFIGTVWVSTSFPSVMGEHKGGSNEPVLAKSESQKSQDGPVAEFGGNVALSFAAVKDQLASIGQYFKQTDYYAEDELVPLEVISPDGQTTDDQKTYER